MNLRLIPICSEEEHIMNYEYKKEYKCEICSKIGISYRCNNCEYSRCSGCHRNILASQEISERLKNERIKNDIKLAEMRLKEDGLTQWEVEIKNSEICYVNKMMRSYSFDYPYTEPPLNSPIDKTEVRTKKDDSNHIRCVIADIYSYMKSFID